MATLAATSVWAARGQFDPGHATTGAGHAVTATVARTDPATGSLRERATGRVRRAYLRGAQNGRRRDLMVAGAMETMATGGGPNTSYGDTANYGERREERRSNQTASSPSLRGCSRR